MAVTLIIAVPKTSFDYLEKSCHVLEPEISASNLGVADKPEKSRICDSVSYLFWNYFTSIAILRILIGHNENKQ